MVVKALSSGRTFAAIIALAASTVPVPVRGQVPAGSTFVIAPTVTFERQARPAVVALPAGDFVVVWNRIRQYQTSQSEVFGQRFQPDGQRRGGEFQVNDFTANSQYMRGAPPVAALGNHDFVVVWQDYQLVAGRGRMFGPTGPRGSEFWARREGVAGAADGRFVTVSRASDAEGWSDIEALRFDSRGIYQGPPLVVNTYTTGIQEWPAVAAARDGTFVVVWTGGSDSGERIHGQRFAADGTRRGGEFHVDQLPASGGQPSVAADADGGFVVAWERNGGIFARRFNLDGVPVAPEIPVDGGSPLLNLEPKVSADATGNFVVTWSRGGFPVGFGAWGRRFNADMTPRGGEFEIAPLPFSTSPTIASDPYGNFMVAWSESPSLFAQPTEVRARRYGGLRPAALAVDTAAMPPSSNGNRVLETCETVDLRPAWHNVNGQAQAFDGDVRAFTGPAGASYVVADGSAAYGTVADGADGACQDCYAATVSCATARPGIHWDATWTEQISPDAHGQVMRWPLHIGDSFTDVTRDSPFYRFVETILHRGLTNGCGSGRFCGQDPVTREQMAVFLVKAFEGPAYQPAPCGGPTGWVDVPPSSPFCTYIHDLTRRGVVAGCGVDRYCPANPVTREQMAVLVMRTAFPTFQPASCGMPMFSDVPASSPFCRWIEELARRGVVGGCGGGRYCPAGSVTREHMAVFVAGGFGLTLYGP